MAWLASIFLTLLAAHGLCLFAFTWRFLCLFSRKNPPTAAVFPRAAVLLPVRGTDPHLAECLLGLLRQDYPLFDIYLIVDSRVDGAWQVISGLPSPGPGVRLHVDVLREPRSTRGLKMSALLQAVAMLDPACEIVALIDGDVIPHPSWLRDLAGPLSDPKVGAATGIRWYAPRTSDWGTLVRYLWNAAAVLHMVALHIPWGGSLAMRTNVLRRSGLLAQWSQSLFEDTACFEALRRLGLTIRFIPEALMVNRENISLTGCCQFIRRQLLDVRLYHPGWRTILALGMLSSAALTTVSTLAAVAITQENPILASALGGGLGAYLIGMVLLLFWIEWRLPRSAGMASRGLAGLRTILAIPLTQVVYFASLMAAIFVRRIEWRGITYEIDGPWSVKMLEYRPWKPAETTGKNESIT